MPKVIVPPQRRSEHRPRLSLASERSFRRRVGLPPVSDGSPSAGRSSAGPPTKPGIRRSSSGLSRCV